MTVFGGGRQAGKSYLAAIQMMDRWRAGDCRPVQVYGDMLELLTEDDLASVGATVTSCAGFKVVTFTAADLAHARWILARRNPTTFWLDGEVI
jgi:hypothetical protein